ncbi:NifB/NifX family molybdenum-iron cluster-binding protein [Thermodesulfobacteriota bacterium]
MKIAIPVWEGKISPVLDTASRLVIFNVENKNATLKGETHLQGIDFIRKCSRIKEMRVDLLICGAVSRHFGLMLANTGVKVIPWIAGSAEEVLDAYINGNLFSPRYIMPGCCGKVWNNFGDSFKRKK